MADQDLFIAALARELSDDDRLFVGANQIDVTLAAHLARKLWAPRLKFWASHMAFVDSGQDDLRVGRSTLDPILVTGRDSTFRQAHAFDDALRAPLMFAGGLQVDAHGNANLAGIHDGTRWVLRGPGSAGLPSLTALADRFFIIAPVHDPRALVTACSRISVVGDPRRRAELGLTVDALQAVLTPIARFEPSGDGLVLTEIVAGVPLADVQARTGFTLRVADELNTRRPLSEVEAETLARLRELSARNRRRRGPSAVR